MERKYNALRIIAIFYQVFASIALLAGVIAVFVIVDRDGGFIAIIGSIIIAAVVIISLLASSESIMVFLDIEENTRRKTPTDSKICLDCGEYVKPEAKVCRFCGHKFGDVDYLKIAEEYKKKKMIPEAINMYEQHIKINPNDPGAYNNFGLLYQEEGNYEKAADSYKKAIEINHGYVEAYRNLISVYESLEDNEKVVEAYEQYKKLNPEADDISEVDYKIKSLREDV